MNSALNVVRFLEQGRWRQHSSHPQTKLKESFLSLVAYLALLKCFVLLWQCSLATHHRFKLCSTPLNHCKWSIRLDRSGLLIGTTGKNCVIDTLVNADTTRQHSFLLLPATASRNSHTARPIGGIMCKLIGTCDPLTCNPVWRSRSLFSERSDSVYCFFHRCSL